MANTGKLFDPAISTHIIHSLAMGKNKCQIARETGVNRSTLYGIEKRSDIRELIEREQRRLVEKVPDAIDYVKALIPGKREDGTVDKPDDIKDRELAYKATQDVLRGVGIFPSASPSQIITNIYNERPLINPTIQMLLDQRDREFEAIDVTENVDEK
jgi:hypothetical protein